ncbi:MAG: rhodanese-like domain-containing protein [Acidimicrobiales bacterium]
MAISEIGVQDLSALLDEGEVALIDVREADEYHEAHVAGAVLIPLSEFAGRTDELPAGQLHLICAAGGRSMKACEFLDSPDRDLVNIAGGTKGWVAAGLPFVTGDQPR